MTQRTAETTMREFHITPAHLQEMDIIALASGRTDDKPKWSVLSMYHRPGYQRPFVSVVEVYDRSGMNGDARRIHFKTVAFGSLARAARWFDDSRLADRLRQLATTWEEPAPVAAPAPLGFQGATILDAARWLYPFGQNGYTEGKLSGFMEADFGIPARTVRSAFAAERNGAQHGAWVAPFIAALRYFDRAAWEKSK